MFPQAPLYAFELVIRHEPLDSPNELLVRENGDERGGEEDEEESVNMKLAR